jgi:methyl-accepting chemotaxis protein
MASWWTKLLGLTETKNGVMDPMPRTVSAHSMNRPVPAITPERTGSIAPGSTVLVDDPTSTGPELAEIKPMTGPGTTAPGSPLGVIVPRNKQELIEELRKNYTEVIDLVRKVNGHLDDQARRQALQDRRQEQMVQLTQSVVQLTEGVSQTLGAIQQQSGQLIETLARLDATQIEVRDALLGGHRQIGESAERIHGTLESIRVLADQTHLAQRESLVTLGAVQVAAEATRDGQAAVDQTLRAMNASVSSVHSTADQLVAISRTTQERAERIDRSNSRWHWMAIAGLALATLVVLGLLFIVLLLRR